MGGFKLDHLISERAAKRSLSHFTSAPTEGKPEGFEPHPDILPLGWGVPTDGFFPIDSIEINLVDYPFQKSQDIPMTNASLECLSFNSSNGGSQGGAIYKMSSNSITIPRYSDSQNTIDISTGLQYSHVPGMPQVSKFVKDLVERIGEPKYKEWDSIVCTGAGDGINKATDAILDHNDVILIEEFSFTPILMSIHNCGAIAVPIKLNINNDSDGIDIKYLTELLENWETLKPGLRRPKALYTIPTGQNPIGLTQTLETRRKIYALAQKFDFLIIEDDPYGYLTLPPYQEDEGIVKLEDLLTVDEYVKNHLNPSYITIDTEGRVIRLETFSKLFGPGLRLGFVVAHKRVIEVITNYAAIVTKFPSGVSQMIFNNVVQKKWGGVEGWLAWIIKMRAAYTRRRNVLLGAILDLEVYKKGYVDAIDPKAGMFLPLLINFPEGTNIPDKISLLNYKFLQFGVSVVPGINMAVDKEFSQLKGNFFRLSFAPSKSDFELLEAAHRLTSALKDFFDKELEF